MCDKEEAVANLGKESPNNVDIEQPDVSLPTELDIGLTEGEAQLALSKYGPNEIPVPQTPLYKLFLHQFTGFLPVLIELAGLISLAVEDFVDFGIIFGILLVNGLLGFREEYHAKKSLDEISNSITSEISVRRDGKTKNVPTTALVPGDIILLVGGTVVPADTKWRSGDKLKIDTAALTGEPLPRTYPSGEYGDLIFSGTTVVAGEAYGEVVATGTMTEIGKAQADILKDKSVHVVSVFQKKIMTVVQVLVSACMCIVLAVFLVSGTVYDGFAGDTKDTVLRALSILIASIPVALPLVLQVNLALGASFMAREHHAIVTSIPALQDIASMSMLCSDKTGTLTTAEMSIIPEQIHAENGFSADDVLKFAFLCCNEDKKDDPIDRAIIQAWKSTPTSESASNDYIQNELIGFNPTVKRVVAFVEQNGKTITIAKGLPAKILDTRAGGVDDHELQWQVEGFEDKVFMEKVTTCDRDLGAAGYKTIAIAICNGNVRQLDEPTWKFVGLLPMLDPPRHDTAATIASLHHANISVKMITGDHVNVGKETARLIGLGTNILAGERIRTAPSAERKDLIWHADGFASVLPSDKRECVVTLRDEFGVVTGMTGDGVNDAPALSAAQVGIAVHGATDAAKNAADLILTEPGLSPIYGAVLESRRIFARIKSYVIYRVAASLILSLTLSCIVFSSGCGVDSIMVIILALLNDISMIPVAYDRAKATTKPQMPRAGKLVVQAVFYGFLHTGFALMFIFILNHRNHYIDLNQQCDSETRGFIWFYLVLVTELCILSVRAPSFFWLSAPSPILLLSVLATCVGGALISVIAMDLDLEAMGFIILFNVVLFVVVDVAKVGFRSLINDDPGDPIDTDELIEVPKEEQPETKKFMEKQLRYNVHRESVMSPSEWVHSVEVSSSGFMDLFTWESHVADTYMMRSQGLLAKGLARQRQPHAKSKSSPAVFSEYF
eukprot:Nitzschia sp. Nitz4//scaffold74_size92883//75836//78832//NITZ4_004832-RA/size92883-augustus-gene-0.8-mRNA-1//1//CDS//3329557622//544//frame0